APHGAICKQIRASPLCGDTPQRPNPGIIQNFPKAHSYPWVMFTNCKHLLLRLILISGDQFIAISSVAL
ncbi:MAG: hypothetical protein IJM59_09480, partial [Proteobacteria bacterium]|nr:hypothetical protein [Pseudomonadota bacterium]